MKSLATFIAIATLAFSTTACSQQHTYSSGSIFGGKTIKGSKNYVTKDIKVDNFTKLNVAGSPDVTFTPPLMLRLRQSVQGKSPDKMTG